MTNPSKTVQLGVIILGLEFLRQLQLPFPRIISAVAECLGLSRKAGYEAAERIRSQLNEEKLAERSGELERLERDNALLEIRVQILAYERDHEALRFAERRRHLPAAAKSLCVRILRDFRARLQPGEIATTIGIAPASLRRWDEQADEHCEFAEKDDGRGRWRHHREEDEERVLALFRSLDAAMSLASFADRYRSEHPERPLDPKTIGRILQGHGLAPLEAKERAKPYHDKVEVYFPGAQAAIDATECKLSFVGRRGEETIALKEQVAIDVASGAILGTALRDEEDAEGVRRVVVRARTECEKLLSVLADKGPANSSGAVRRVVDESSELGGPIFSFPYHPRTNGHIEGLFGQFKRSVARIEIDDSSRRSIARSVLEIVWRIYTRFHNSSPRRRLDGISPIEHLRRYALAPGELDAARRGLEKRKERSRALRAPNPRLQSEEFIAVVDRVLAEHRFEVERARALRSLVAFDTEIIASSSRAFFVASRRDGFQETKRSFAYFMGIVRRKQRDNDSARLRRRVERDRSRQMLERARRHDREVERERAEDAEDLRRNPERIIDRVSKLLMSGEFRLMAKSRCRELRAALESLQRLGRNTTRVITRLGLEIRSLGTYREELKRRMVDLLVEEAHAARERASVSGAAAPPSSCDTFHVSSLTRTAPDP